MKYLLITGSYRSGTTYLYKALNNNKKIEILYQPAIKLFKYLDLVVRKKLKKKIFKDFPLGITNINKKIRIENLFLKKKEIIKIVKNLQKKKNKNFLYYNKVLNNLNTKNNVITANEFIDIIFKSTIKKKNNKVIIVGIKEPFVGSLLKILIQYNKLLIINIIRDPREILYSRNYSLFKNHNDFKNKKHPVILTSLICNENMKIDRFLCKKKNYLSVNFKNLINNTKNLQEKISKFLNIKINLDKKIVQKKSKWKINSSGLVSNYGSEWKGKIFFNELAILEKICGKNMDKYGFRLMINEKRKIKDSLNKFKEDKSNILSWTNNNIFLKYSEDSIKIL